MTPADPSLTAAFDGLKRYETCPAHKWTKPRRTVRIEYRREVVRYETRCRLCGLRASRPTLERLAELPERGIRSG